LKSAGEQTPQKEEQDKLAVQAENQQKQNIPNRTEKNRTYISKGKGHP
jgi:hypothetical protein